jgi:peptidoglycan/xylan/chitin deacetylase (PgdA/CDA1 family)
MFFIFHFVRYLAKIFTLRYIIEWGSKLTNTGMIYYAENQTEPVVYLTIDDFPPKNATFGNKLLDILEDDHVPACFFVVQYNLKSDPRHKELFERVLANGNELGNHYDIDSPATDLTGKEFVQYLIGTENWILKFDPEFNSRLPKFFRPPSGKSNAMMTSLLKKYQYINILGDIYTFDGDYDDEWEKHADMIVENVQKGSIIIIHTPDFNKRQKTYKILKNIIPRIRNKGFKFDLLSNYFRKNKNLEKNDL